jgi:DNA-binding response OmpR family regulator
MERRQYTRATRPRPVVISHEGLTVDPVGRVAVLDGADLDLTLKEFDLLVAFASSPGRVFSRGELLEQVWETKPDWQSVDTVTEHVYRLRQKLDAAGADRNWIETVRGAGYRFAAVGAAAPAEGLRSIR